MKNIEKAQDLFFLFQSIIEEKAEFLSIWKADLSSSIRLSQIIPVTGLKNKNPHPSSPQNTC